MRKLMLFAGWLLAAAIASAQTEAPQFYRFEFVLKEMDGAKLVQTHTYQTIVSTNDRGQTSIRSGAKVPIIDPKGTTYIDVGTDIDIRNLTTIRDGLSFQIVVNTSGSSGLGSGTQLAKVPLIYQTKWDARVEIPIGKSTMIFSSDDPASKHQLQLEVRAAPLQ